MKIERPELFRAYTAEKNRFDEWFNEEVEPINKMLEQGVEVYGCNHERQWINIKEDWHQYKALLINIQPIKKETAEDLLRALVEDSEHMDEMNWGAKESRENFLRRAKAVLENK